mmetsp:Transcript_29313/g.40450  ORF Transcript_29313/g.40450 Transcript_29313/m.40450 type:complete len:165 (+) Transcript_29313:20-514(+)
MSFLSLLFKHSPSFSFRANFYWTPIKSRNYLNWFSQSQLRWTSEVPLETKTQKPGSSSILFSEASTQRLEEILDENEVLRVEVNAGGCSGFQYGFHIEKLQDICDEDIIVINGGAKVVIDEVSLGLISGSMLDYVQEMISSSFRLTGNPHADLTCSCGVSFAAR